MENYRSEMFSYFYTALGALASLMTGPFRDVAELYTSCPQSHHEKGRRLQQGKYYHFSDKLGKVCDLVLP